MKRCNGCGLLENWCCCEQLEPTDSKIKFALLLNKHEPDRPTTTSKLIQKILPNTLTYIWERKQPPQELLQLINSPEINTYLLFPADREGLPERLYQERIDSKQETLIIVPDGTWKEVRKIVRKSPWLERIPIIALQPESETQYDLRRNKYSGQLCTAEAIATLLEQNGEMETAHSLQDALFQFMRHYKCQQQEKHSVVKTVVNTEANPADS